MTGYYLGRRESQAVMVILVHYHRQYSLVARVHRHGGPDLALVLGNVGCSLDQRHCSTSARHHHWSVGRAAPSHGAYYHRLEVREQ